jgi:outer membrane protein assembly factor BamD
MAPYLKPRSPKLRSRPLLLLAVPAALFVAIVGAGCGKREDPILLLSAAEALEQGKDLLAKEKYYKASKLLTHAFEVEPNSRSGREALLLAADSLYMQGGTDNYIKCEAKYRDFLNRFPTSDRSDYAQYKVAACLAARAERPDRDQKITREALAAFEELLRLFPTSEHLGEAREKIRDLTDRLAAHELVIGNFYNSYGRYGICEATQRRLETVRDEYPEFRQMDEVLFSLGVAYSRCLKDEQASNAFEDLRRRFPDSPMLAKIDKFQEEWAKDSVEIRQRDEALRKMLGNTKEQAEAAAKAKGEDAQGGDDAKKDGAGGDQGGN